MIYGILLKGCFTLRHPSHVGISTSYKQNAVRDMHTTIS
jgi:hypothetical protein